MYLPGIRTFTTISLVLGLVLTVSAQNPPTSTPTPVETATLAPAQQTVYLMGPIVDAYQAPFLYVYGASGPNNYENTMIERYVQDVVDKWKLLRNRTVPVKKDVDVTEKDIQAYHLILYGNEENNLLLKKIADKMPIRFKTNEVIVGDVSYKGYDVGAIFVHPNPLNPKRYVLVYGTANYDYLKGVNAVPASDYDYVIFNDKSKVNPLKGNAQPPLETGYFDKSSPLLWKVKPHPKKALEPVLPAETSYNPAAKPSVKIKSKTR